MTQQIPGGYNGKILRVNLTKNKISAEDIDSEVFRKYLGGAGFTTHYLWKELKPKVNPLGPDNKLVIALGPLTGIRLSGAARHCIGAKSPLTGGIAKAEVGGFWGAELKRAGYDVIIIEGKAEKPVYLWIKDGEASIKDASRLWGKNTKETQQGIHDELGDNKIRVAMIGPAGEKLVLYACIMHGLFDAAGRGGLGAVMGSKNLKAIAVRGNKLPNIGSPDRVKELREWLIGNIANNPNTSGYHDLGTGVPMNFFAQVGNLPVRNFRDGVFPGIDNITPQKIKDTIRVGMDGCFACVVRCKRVVKCEEPYKVDSAYGGPEYEALAALGSNCGIDDLKAISKASELCNAYSLDTISTGNTIAWAMECFEKGLLTLKDTGGIELRFGNADAMIKTVKLIAQREGIGKLLSEGTMRTSKKIGKGSADFAMHVKGLEVAEHDPRFMPGLGLSFMLNPTGGDHMLAGFDTAFANEDGIMELKPFGIVEPVPIDDYGTRKVELMRLVRFRKLLNDTLCMCNFLPYSLEQLANVTAGVTGWDIDSKELMLAGERILTLAQLFNGREGFTAADDTLPLRFFQPKSSGPLSEHGLDQTKVNQAKNYYYTIMGWNPVSGVPKKEKLEELGLT
jgi:aldehyde:ferredoxin oxidoreductase